MLIKSWFEYLTLSKNNGDWETGKSTCKFYSPQPSFYTKLSFIQVFLRFHPLFTKILQIMKKSQFS